MPDTPLNIYGQSRGAAAIITTRAGAERLVKILEEAIRRIDGVDAGVEKVVLADSDFYNSDGEPFRLLLMITDPEDWAIRISAPEHMNAVGVGFNPDEIPTEDWDDDATDLQNG